MLKRLSMLFLALCCLTTLAAKDLNQYTGSILWKISGNGLDAPSYILGTHHLTPGSYTDNIPGFKEAFEASQQVVGEILIGDKQDLQMKVLQLAQMPEGVTYADVLSAEEYSALDAVLKEHLKVGMDNLGKLKPFVINLTLTGVIYSQIFPDINLAQMVAMDNFVQEAAVQQGKKVKGLETVDFQLSVFETDPIEAQIHELACSLNHLDYMIETIKLMTDYYNRADLTGLTKLLDDEKAPCPMSKEMEHRLLKERNNNWLQVLPAMMKEASTFVAVGALHLPGEVGLLHQLSQMGYTVTPVK